MEELRNEKGVIALMDPNSPLSPAGKQKRIEQKANRLTPHQYKEARRRVRKENLSMCCQIVIFVVFLMTFTFTVLFESNSSAPLLAAHIRAMLSEGPGSKPLNGVTDSEGLYKYLKEVFVPTMYASSTDTEMATELSSQLHAVDSSNRLLGVVRLRQVRVGLQQDCQTAPMFAQYTINCYPPFSSVTESTQSYGPGGKFSHSKDPEGKEVSGILGSYTGDGFMQMLPTNLTSAQMTLDQLHSDGYIDDATRAVFLDYSLWNGNVGMYAVVGIMIEFGASGGVKTSVDVVTMTESNLTPLGLGLMPNLLALAGNILLTALVLWFLAEEMQEVCHDWLEYITDESFWNAMDWMNLILIGTAFGYKVASWMYASQVNVGQKELQDPTSFTNLRALADLVETSRLINAINAVFMWCKVLKYYRHMPLLRELIQVIWRALGLFVPYLIMFCVAFMGFCMAYNIGFGDKLYELSTFGSTVIFLIRAFIRDIELMPAYDITPAFGALLILLFYVAMVLVGTIVMFSILANAQFEAKYDKTKEIAEMEKLHEDEPVEEAMRFVRAKMRRFIRKTFPWLYVKLYKRRKLDPDGNPIEGEGDDNNAFGPDGQMMAIGDSAATTVSPSASRNMNGGWRKSLAVKDKEEDDDEESDDDDLPSREGLMRAIEHMSGRVLSEISILGIEIKSELHDVCERVAQMKIAVEELSWRTDQIHLEQSEEL